MYPMALLLQGRGYTLGGGYSSQRGVHLGTLKSKLSAAKRSWKSKLSQLQKGHGNQSSRGCKKVMEIKGLATSPPPFAAAAGTAADAASAAEPPPVAAAAVTAVAPGTAAAVAAVSAAADGVGGAWGGGRAPWEGRGRGGSRGRFGSILDLDVFFWLVWRRFCFFISCVCNTVHLSRR